MLEWIRTIMKNLGGFGKFPCLTTSKMMSKQDEVMPMQLLIQYAMSFIGLPYKWGGSNPMEGMDCSGLVQIILESVGMDPPGDQTAANLFSYFLANSKASKAKAGAIAFYGSSRSNITHIAFCLDHFRVIEAGGGGSKTNTRDDAIR